MITNYIQKYFISFGWKDIVYLFILVFCILLFRTCHSTSVVPASPIIQKAVDKADKKGTAYTEIKGIIYTQAYMKRVSDSLSRTLSKGKVTQVTQTITRYIHDTVQTKLYMDTLTGDIRAYDSTKDYRQAFFGNTRTNKGTFSLDIVPDTQTCVSAIKHHLFKPDELTTNIYHTNDLFKPVSGYTYTSRTPKTIACIGPYVGMSYTGAKLQPAIGVGITFNLIPIRR